MRALAARLDDLQATVRAMRALLLRDGSASGESGGGEDGGQECMGGEGSDGRDQGPRDSTSGSGLVPYPPSKVLSRRRKQGMNSGRQSSHRSLSCSYADDPTVHHPLPSPEISVLTELVERLDARLDAAMRQVATPAVVVDRGDSHRARIVCG